MHARSTLQFLVALVTLMSCDTNANAGEAPLGLPRVSVREPERPGLSALGRRLFFDKRISADGTIACSSCHDPKLAFSDGNAVATGVGGKNGTRNAPSLFNVAFQNSLFWDGRAADLETQARAPLLNPVEHGLHEADVVSLVRSDASYQRAFAETFGIAPKNISMSEIVNAFANFERTLLAGDTPFDRYYYGAEKSALSPSAIRGLALFQGRAHCASCHLIDEHSALLTDQQYHNSVTGLPESITVRLATLSREVVDMKNRGDVEGLDRATTTRSEIAALGRFLVSLDPADIGKFKTPSLRNVALTAPYMHDGSIQGLERAVDIELYVRGAAANYPIVLTTDERQELLAFLRSLTSPAAQ